MTSVKLSKSYSAPDGTAFDTITLREPTYKDVFMDGLGQPREWQPVAGGSALLTYPERVDAYAQRLIVKPGYEFISGLTALDALRIEEAICGFFMEPKEQAKSETNSSSDSDGDQQT
ncbi:phage tail assembly protein [Pseudorhizobium halotolerans]|uniref:Phage tail assembly protein n=1 Tax=Pseudorhizobium halotolerans TaxID=1233081 RepID=A0ABM8PLE6_9HYPH|nr:phage tail assembly protein [Pseudorhizobium halotolerans]CAD7036388.1 phage tail assembly protein [Pseudorhizobium halotolerans]